MFEVTDNESVGFKSTWKVTKISIESAAQTDDLKTAESATSTALRASVEVQTDDDPPGSANYDEEKLASFLKKVFPTVEKELDEALASQAFREYSPNWGETEIKAKLVKKVAVAKNYPVCSITWNSTGRTVAATCNQVHSIWCHHTGNVKLYSYNRYDELSDAPTHTLQFQSCVTSIKFHPNLPSIIAGGSYSGEVVIWNLQSTVEDGGLLTKLTAHEESVTQMLWVYGVDVAKSILLATSSLDGNLIMWNFNPLSAELKVKERYKIRSPIFAKVKRKKDLPSNVAGKLDRGIIDFDFSKFYPHMFVVAAEGGLVVQCSTLGAKSLKSGADDAPTLDPIYKYYQSHEGELTSIRFSPNRKELFATNGTDGQIHVYVLEQEEPALKIFTQTQMQILAWVPFEEKLLAACGESGKLCIYDVKKGKPIEYDAEATEGVADATALCAMEINNKRVTNIALGTVDGGLQVWTIPWHFHSENIK